jgi:hypothetical protein
MNTTALLYSNPGQGIPTLSLPPPSMVFRSLLPPIPDLSLPNAHHLFLNCPGQAEWEDCILHVDAPTGETREWLEFNDRVKRGATVFGSPSHFPRSLES